MFVDGWNTILNKASCRHRLVIMNTAMFTMLTLANLEFVLIVGPET